MKEHDYYAEANIPRHNSATTIWKYKSKYRAGSFGNTRDAIKAYEQQFGEKISVKDLIYVARFTYSPVHKLEVGHKRHYFNREEEK